MTNRLSLDEAKKIVLAKYPNARCWWLLARRIIKYDSADGNHHIVSDPHNTPKQAWLSAAERIKEKK